MELFDRLWENYISLNPEAKRIHDLFIEEGEKIINDHIAFRTFDDPKIDIDILAKPFIEMGYVPKGNYYFQDKKLIAKHYEIEGDELSPRIFISKLELSKFSTFLQNTVISLIEKIPSDITNDEPLILKGNLWGKPSYETYNRLRQESEYAAWLYVYGFCPNHFTISVNFLKKFTEIAQVNEFLKSKGFLINSSGGEIKGSPADLLEQSSTMASLQEIEFIEGRYIIPSTYYEFAKRYPDSTGHIYGGFVEKSADKIFESTDYYQK